MVVDSISDLPYENSVVATDLSLILVESSLEVPDYFRWKVLATRILGGMLLVLSAPVALVLMAMVCLTSAGPGIYRQKRVGRGGHEFFLYKIRTMFQDAETALGPTWCQPGDSRITFIGKLLRFLHLDELPQLLNIVRGEMDLIGPRPERPEFIEKLVEEIPGYAERLAVLPGVTGLAQINLPPDVTIDCVRRKLVLDLEYIQTASFGLDFRILLCTALRMVGVRYGYAVSLLKLGRPKPRLESALDPADLKVREMHPAIAYTNGHHHNGNGSTPKPHLPVATPLASEEIPTTMGPRNPR